MAPPAEEAEPAETPRMTSQSKTIAQIKRENYDDLNECEEINISGEYLSVIMESFEEAMATAEEVKISVAADSGAVAHGCHPKDPPDSVKVDQRRIRNFHGAGGEGLKHFGTAKVRLQHQNGGHTSNNFEVMNVCRPLHSVSMICDNECDMLYKKDCAYVVPEGVFDQILAMCKIIAEYPRKGGLYVAEVTVKDPDAKNSSPASPASFAGPGAGR